MIPCGHVTHGASSSRRCSPSVFGSQGSSCCVAGGPAHTEDGCLFPLGQRGATRCLPAMPGQSQVLALLLEVARAARVGQVMSWHQCQQIVGRGCWLCMVHANQTLPFLVASWHWGGCDCPCAGRSVLAALGPQQKPGTFSGQLPRPTRGLELEWSGLATASWKLSSIGCENG